MYINSQPLVRRTHTGWLEQWLRGFDTVEDGVRQSVGIIRNHPLLPRDVPVHGLIIHPETGKLDVLVEGYQRTDGRVQSV